MSELQNKSAILGEPDARATEADVRANLDLATIPTHPRPPQIINLPRYRCHKEVQAFKIAKIESDWDVSKRENRSTVFPDYWLTPEDDKLPRVRVTNGFIKRHHPQVGWYFVLYPNDNYQSASPAEPFENGYTLIPDEQPKAGE